MKKLYSALYSDSGYPFNALLDDDSRDNVQTIRDPEEMQEKDSALVIWGGADIHPELYNHPMHRTTYPGGQRDRLEWALLNRAVDLGIPIIGVCRGAQMLCARAGGWLIQDVNGHAGGAHWVATHDGDQFLTNSIHHQMMAGLGTVDHQLVAWSVKRLSDSYGYMDNQWFLPQEGWKEPEFVYFPKIKGYAIQWHPEGMAQSSPATEYVLKFITEKEKESVLAAG